MDLRFLGIPDARGTHQDSRKRNKSAPSVLGEKI